MRLMAVHAHPDDESSKGAATMARYVAEGHEVMVVTCTGGERGDILNPAMNQPGVLDNMAEIRRGEMANAAEILGVQHRWLGYVDSGLPEGEPLPPLPEGCFALVPLEVSVPKLVKEIREFRPHVIVTYDENGGYPHPDHIRTHEISMAAFEEAADPESHEGLGEPWQALKVYYSHGFSRAKMMKFHNALLERGQQSPYAEWIQRMDEAENKEGSERRPDSSTRVTTQVPCGEYFEVRDKALLAHATQIDPNASWFRIDNDLQRELWPTEDYELARSLVDTTLPESDLFTGISEHERTEKVDA